MKPSLFFFIRRLFAGRCCGLRPWQPGRWFSHQKSPWPFGLICVLAFLYVVISSASHLRRVRLISDHVDSTTLANRQRRQIEIPFEANEAFAIVDAAIRDLPTPRTSPARRIACKRVPKCGALILRHGDSLFEMVTHGWAFRATSADHGHAARGHGQRDAGVRA